MAEPRTGLRGRHLITGGSGYVGRRLAQHLARNGVSVVVIDRAAPDLCFETSLLGRIEFKQGDITDLSTFVDHFKDVQVVYHLASYGMSGREQFFPDKIKRVNVDGTNNVIKACLLHGVERLVYASTFNVVFHGQPIKNGDESLPYRDTNKQTWDNYACTKTHAEKAVLAVSGTKLASGRTLHTCALRFAGIYGPGEQRHIPRIVNLMTKGLFAACIGNNPITEFVHVENVVNALSLAEQALTQRRGHVASGQPYFISDGKPVDSYEFFRPLANALDVHLPTFWIPVFLAYYIGFFVELLYRVFHEIYDFNPLISRAEVFKVGVTHYFSLEKAKRELLYEPLYQNDMSEIADFYLRQRMQSSASERTACRRRAERLGWRSWLVNFVCFAAFICLILSLLPMVM